MAKQNTNTPSEEENVLTRLYDQTGRLRLESGFQKREYEEDNCDKCETISEYIETSQKTIWGIADFLRAGADKVNLETCDKCEEELFSLFHRTNSKISLSPAPSMRRCVICRRNLCQKHHFISRIDGVARCRFHHICHLLYRKIVFRILFRWF